jgi:hypothetical protein
MPALSRARRVSAEHAVALARHLTERDREVALCLYEQQLLTTDQLTLLFFSSKRRAQDRLLFLHRQRVLDRFYPASRFGSGKPQAHWLLDEAGAHIVSACLDVERKQLGWQRRQDWGSHPQLAHRLELNRFATDLIAATLTDPRLGVSAWFGPRQAAARLGKRARGNVRPDSELILITGRGAVDLLLEWDRGSETLERLEEKLRRYRNAESRVDWDDDGPRSVLFVVAGPRRLQNLRQLATELGRVGSWPILATTTGDLESGGPLGSVWQRLDVEQPPCPLAGLPVREVAGVDLDPAAALGRRWRHDQSGFWRRLSPLGLAPATDAQQVPEVANWPPDSAQPCGADAANRGSPSTDTDQADPQHPGPQNGSYGLDLRPSGIAGFMNDSANEEEPWQ